MTGRDLILYILQNNLEDEPVFKDGKILGFMNVEEAAVKYEVGVATVKLWFRLGMLPAIVIGEEIYIPADTNKPNTKIEYTEQTFVL